MREATGFKRTRKYKEIRRFLRDFIGIPDYTDHIVNGVSFKWFVDGRINENLPHIADILEIVLEF